MEMNRDEPSCKPENAGKNLTVMREEPMPNPIFADCQREKLVRACPPRSSGQTTAKETDGTAVQETDPTAPPKIEHTTGKPPSSGKDFPDWAIGVIVLLIALILLLIVLTIVVTARKRKRARAEMAKMKHAAAMKHAASSEAPSTITSSKRVKRMPSTAMVHGAKGAGAETSVAASLIEVSKKKTHLGKKVGGKPMPKSMIGTAAHGPKPTGPPKSMAPKPGAPPKTAVMKSLGAKKK